MDTDEAARTGRRLLAFLTDYGPRDGFPAVCHAVIAGIAPDVRVLDLTHDVPPGNVRHGAAVLRRVASYLGPAVYLGVVDPGVGTSRRPVALRAGPSLLVGPDNGLLLPAAEALGGVDEAYHLTDERWWLPRVGATFHGRDVFAPVAARLAAGVSPAEVGEPLEPAQLVRLPEPYRELRDGVLTCEVTYVDHFGNAQLAADTADLAAVHDERSGQAVTVRVGDQVVVVSAGRTFGDVAPGELLVYADSDGRLAIAENGGSVADRIGLRPGTRVQLLP